MILRPEIDTDRAAIRAVTTAAFESHVHSDGSEPRIIDALRDAGALTLSLVAEIDGQVIGHVAFSPVTWAGAGDWFGMGPVSVAPEFQNRLIGRRLIERGLDSLRQSGARGCVVLGEPAYYRRFGFLEDARLTYAGAPAIYFMALAFGPVEGSGEVRYHPAFG